MSTFFSFTVMALEVVKSMQISCSFPDKQTGEKSGGFISVFNQQTMILYLTYTDWEIFTNFFSQSYEY